MIRTGEVAAWQLLPDRFIDNDNVENLADALHHLYEPPVRRILLGEEVGYRGINGLSWEIALRPDEITWHVATPSPCAEYVHAQARSCWPRSAILEQHEGKHLHMAESKAVAATLHLRHHYFMSLSTDRRTLAPIPEICKTAKALSAGDRALVQIILVPASPDWYQGVEEAMQRFKRGEMPGRWAADSQRILQGVFLFGARVGAEIMATCAELITDKETPPVEIEDPDRAAMVRHGGLSNATLGKGRQEAFDVTIRLAVESEAPGRRRTILRSLISAFRGLNGDNELVAKDERNTSKILQAIAERRPPLSKINPDLLGVDEVARLLQLPPWSLQEEYPIDNIANRELPAPARMTRPGIMLGSVTQRGDAQPVYWPTDNTDELCLPRVVIGGVGTGKSLGFGAGFAVDAIRAGHSVFAVDVTDGDMADMVRDTLPADFPGDHIIDLDFGDISMPIGINWSEVAQAGLQQRHMATRLSSQLVTFLRKFATDMGPRTQRYIKAAGQVAFSDPNSTLLEVLLMLLSDSYREQVIPTIKDPRLRIMWEDFRAMSAGLKSQVTAPVLNRLDTLMGNEYVANCILQRPKNNPQHRIDFRRWADGDERGPYCVILRVNKSMLFEEATDVLVTYLLSKLWLAILTRIDQPISARKPAFLIMDEPHQYLGGARGGVASTWASMITESRKWRLGLVFLFHDWQQMGPLGRLLKSAAPHYTLYSSSKDTFRELQEEIAPYTVEEAMEMPTHYALNVIRAGNKYHRLLVQMAKPPLDKAGRSWRHRKVDQSHRTRICSQIYGRPVDRVEDDIYERERILYRE